MPLVDIFEKHPLPWEAVTQVAGRNTVTFLRDRNDVVIDLRLLPEIFQELKRLRNWKRLRSQDSTLCSGCRGKGYESGPCLKCELDKLHLLIDRYIGFNVDTTKLKEEASATMRSYLERRLS